MKVRERERTVAVMAEAAIGAITFTAIPYLAPSRARVLVKATSPTADANQAVSSNKGKKEETRESSLLAAE